MTKILFVCHGNICRSTMAQFVLTHLAKKMGRSDDFVIESKGTSREELGNPPHPGTLHKMKEMGIPTIEHYATQLKKSDYNLFDFIIGMDSWNLHEILRITGGDPKGKVRLLLDFTNRPGEIDDPWYTNDFDSTYRDILEGCKGILKTL